MGTIRSTFRVRAAPTASWPGTRRRHHRLRRRGPRQHRGELRERPALRRRGNDTIFGGWASIRSTRHRRRQLNTAATMTSSTPATERYPLGSNGPTRSSRAGNDLIYGQGGDDTLDGGSGNDTSTARPGSDSLIGGAGDDTWKRHRRRYPQRRRRQTTPTFSGTGLGSDQITETRRRRHRAADFSSFGAPSRPCPGSTSPQTVNASHLTLTLSDAAPSRTSKAGQRDSITGNGLANMISGRRQRHLLRRQRRRQPRGGAGDDDIYVAFTGGSGNKKVYEDAGGGTDACLKWIGQGSLRHGLDLGPELTASISVQIMTANSIERLCGTAYADLLYGTDNATHQQRRHRAATPTTRSTGRRKRHHLERQLHAQFDNGIIVYAGAATIHLRHPGLRPALRRRRGRLDLRLQSGRLHRGQRRQRRALRCLHLRRPWVLDFGDTLLADG